MTVRSPAFATHIRPAAATMSEGPCPIGYVATTQPRAGSIRATTSRVSGPEGQAVRRPGDGPGAAPATQRTRTAGTATDGPPAAGGEPPPEVGDPAGGDRLDPVEGDPARIPLSCWVPRETNAYGRRVRVIARTVSVTRTSPASARRAHPGGDVHRAADGTLPGGERLARVDPDPDADRALRGARRPGGVDDREPGLDRRRGGGEDDVDAVALGADLRALLRGDRVADERAVRREQLRRGVVAVRVDEGGIAAQVAEEEAVGPRGACRHRRPPCRSAQDGAPPSVPGASAVAERRRKGRMARTRGGGRGAGGRAAPGVRRATRSES